MKRPGMAELAQAAGVSIATVDRFLNGREAVRADTRARILEAAQRIGHPAARRLAPVDTDLPELRFGVVLHKQGQDFYKAFAEELVRAVAAAQELNVPEIVIKRGAAPTLVRSGSSPWHSVPTQTLATVVDTTAAGDSFAAGFLSRRLRGTPPEEAAQFGNRLAARVIAHRGAIIPLDVMADLL